MDFDLLNVTKNNLKPNEKFQDVKKVCCWMYYNKNLI